MSKSKEDEKWEKIGAIVGSALLLTSYIYTFNNRKPIEWFGFGLFIGFFVFIILLCFYVYDLFKNGFKKPTFKTIIVGVLFPITCLTAGMSYYSIGVSLKDSFLWLVSVSHTIQGTIIYIILLCLILGISLFYFRLKRRVTFGFIETLTGLLIAGYKAYSDFDKGMQNTDFYLAILTASIFLVVRGADNMHQGWNAEKKDPFAMWVYRKLFRATSDPMP